MTPWTRKPDRREGGPEASVMGYERVKAVPGRRTMRVLATSWAVVKGVVVGVR